MDIAFHLKTSYQDFFDHYLELPETDKDILAMRQEIKAQRNKTWADLEVGLGVYSAQCETKEVFLKCLNDIKKKLEAYLRGEATKIGSYSVSSLTGFISLGKFFDPEPQTRYNAYRSRLDYSLGIDIITFNYTSTLEYIFDFKNSPISFNQHAVLRSINHIHGTLDNMMVMGVNDPSQIKNDRFNTDLDVIEDFVKPEYNDACLNNKNAICESLIENANIIVVYGTSLGPSDDKWWKLIGSRMEETDYPLLVYLPYDEKKNKVSEPNHLRRWTRDYVAEIRQKFGITLDEKYLLSRICVAINNPLFSITPNKREIGTK